MMALKDEHLADLHRRARDSACRATGCCTRDELIEAIEGKGGVSGTPEVAPPSGKHAAEAQEDDGDSRRKEEPEEPEPAVSETEGSPASSTGCHRVTASCG